MGKASRWFRSLLGFNQPHLNPNPNKLPKDRRRWRFVKSYREKSHAKPPPPSYTHVTPTATSSSYVETVAEAAVVRLTNSGWVNYENITKNGGRAVAHVSSGEERVTWSAAAVVVQSHFRGYLARRALRALKGLVKLQAHVRGHIMRRKTAETMHCMQSMLRAQARARLVRAHIPESPYSSTKSCPILLHPGPPTPDKFEQIVCAKSIEQDQSPKIKRNSSKSSNRINTMSQDRTNFGSSWSDPQMDDLMSDPQATASSRTCLTDDNRAVKILEIDTGKPHQIIRRRSLFESSHSCLLTLDQRSLSQTTSKDSRAHQTVQSPGSCEVVQYLKPPITPEIIDDNSLQYCSATSQGGSSSRRGISTPTKSDGCFSGYSDCPSYMAYTESAKAKRRSISAPKQRPQYERTTSTKRYSVHGLGNTRSNAQRASAMHASFTSKAYPGSGRLDRLGMPARDSTVVYYSGYLN